MTAWNDSDFYNHPHTVTPFEPANVNPASNNLNLGNRIQRAHPIWKRITPDDLRGMCDGYMIPHYADDCLSKAESKRYYESKCSIDTLPKWGPVETFTSTWLMPGEFVLGCTAQRVTAPNDTAFLMLCTSSTARNGTHNLLGCWVDPGFDGDLTLEIHNVAPWPFRLVAGMDFVQIVGLNLSAAPLRTYAETGRYQGQQGPTPARGER